MTITIIHQAPLSSETLIRHTQPNVTLHVTPVSRLIQHPGTLYITDECLYFFSEASNNTGFSISYPSIIIHAIARESLVGPNIYCQLEGTLESASASNGANGHTDGAEDEDEDEDDILELSFAPADVSSLDTIYEHLSYCASLHQDEDAEDDYDMDQGDYEDMDGIPFSTSATAIGYSAHQDGQDDTSVDEATETTGVETMPMIDLENGEWYTGNQETDAKFELSQEGQVMVNRWQLNLENKESSSGQNPLGKRGRQEGDAEDEEQLQEGAQPLQQDQYRQYSEEEAQEARSKMWRAY
ncbi:hypothetical protein BGW38_010200 [Lunasporangiospora selenospora]|uniref:Regulator of volume decrease after cellular swelling-domain-containing protein n=1 Tax=Lunasporangiospora selenospora TaxID=979761 RepID=A0A9P6FXV8_9FUNG|nr:hypothetical protein BGW38_010200 [Lunasporangiospora selenospora]